MKLYETQRCELAEKICRRWIRRRGLKMAAPKVYLLVKQPNKNETAVWGWSHYEHRSKGCYITLHVGFVANKRDKYILLCHEFAHQLDVHTSQGIWRRHRQPHGERFQRLLWGLVPRGLWKRASSGTWILHDSRHRPEFQPD